MSDRVEWIAWLECKPRTCAICGAPVDTYDCKQEHWVELHGRILRAAVFAAIVDAACTVAKLQQHLIDSGWTPPEESAALLRERDLYQSRAEEEIARRLGFVDGPEGTLSAREQARGVLWFGERK